MMHAEVIRRIPLRGDVHRCDSLHVIVMGRLRATLHVSFERVLRMILVSRIHSV